MIYGSDYMDNFLYENGPKSSKISNWHGCKPIDCPITSINDSASIVITSKGTEKSLT